MPEMSVSRRAFFSQVGSGAALGAVPAGTALPQKAWIIVALGWEYNDEFSYHEGEYPQSHVYFDKEQADQECQRRCQAFYAGQTPAQFEADFEGYLFDAYQKPGFDESQITWEDLLQAGFPEPYYVLELTRPDAAAADGENSL